jgi:hypothetical protein
MEQRVSIVTLGVADLTRSANFCERLGWRPSMAKAEGIVFLRRDRASVGSQWLITLGVVKRLIRCSPRRTMLAPNS